MIGLKRFIHPGVVISVIGHVGALLLGLIFFGASSLRPMSQDSMLVDIVPPDEAPRLQGTPSDLRTSGSEVSAKSANASVAQPPPKPAPPSPQQQQQRSNPQQNARQAMAQPQTAKADTAHAETAEPENAQIQMSEPPPAPPRPQPEDTPDQPSPAETFAQLALMGGRLGGGFAAPPIGALQPTYDFTAPFRERVSSCSAMPPGIDVGDKISVTLRVSLNRDGTLASPPQLLDPVASPKEEALVQSAIQALQKCQPYTLLPPARYKEWKTLDLTFFPLSLFGG
ncbi:MAG: hypothetical protein P4L80_04615 [Xanthobacteraceae bacterium]|nr:hypothetical protein [Xanthobacteraceae bacterium]